MRNVGLTKLARQLLTESGNDITVAKRRMDRFIKVHRSDFLDYLTEALTLALEDIWRSGRERVSDFGRRPEPPGSPALQRAYQEIAAGIYDWPLSYAQGLVLGDATAADLDEWLSRRKVQLETELTDVTWLSEVAKTLRGTTQKVREVYTPEGLLDLRTEAAQAVRDRLVEDGLAEDNKALRRVM